MTIFGVTRAPFHKKYSFTIEINGVVEASFRAMSELAMEIAVISHSEGGSLIPDSSPGRVSTDPVTLTRGVTDNKDLFAWFQQGVEAGSVLSEPEHKRTIDVVQRDRNQQELTRWTLVNCWPTRYVAGDWDNEADENTIETLVLKFDFFFEGGDNSP